MLKPSTEQLEYAKQLLGVAWTAVLTVGGLVVVSYCWSEGFLPDGISFGDAFLLAYASFSFTIILAIGTLFGAVCALWLVNALVWGGNRYCKKKVCLKPKFESRSRALHIYGHH